MIWAYSSSSSKLCVLRQLPKKRLHLRHHHLRPPTPRTPDLPTHLYRIRPLLPHLLHRLHHQRLDESFENLLEYSKKRISLYTFASHTNNKHLTLFVLPHPTSKSGKYRYDEQPGPAAPGMDRNPAPISCAPCRQGQITPPTILNR